MVVAQTPKYAFIFIATVVSMFANYNPLPFFTGSELVFGNVFAVAITLLFGFRAGFVCCFLSGLVTFLNWHHFLIILPFSIEIAVIAYAISKAKSPLIFGVIYWLTFGWVIVCLEYYFLTDYLDATKTAIIFKYILNGLLNVIGGYVIAFAFKHFRTTSWQDKFRISQFIAVAVSILITFAVLANTYFWLKNTQEDKLKQLETSLTLEAKIKAKEINNYIDNHLNALVLASKIHHDEVNQQAIKSTLLDLKSTYPNILTMLITDAEGDIFGTAPKSLLAIIQDANSNFTNVSARPYFYESKNTMLPFVSDVFQGRGFGNDPIVALSVPLSSSKGFVGIMEASLDLTKFAELDTKILSEHESLLIFDQHHKVIYSSENLPYSFLQDIRNLPINQYIRSPSNYFYVDNSKEYRIGMSEKISSLNWTVFVAIPRMFYEDQVSENIIFSTKLLILFLIISLFITFKFAQLFSHPIEQLNKRLLSFSKSGDFENLQLNLAPSSFVEIDSMSSVIQTFSERLKETLFSLQRANVNTEVVNQELAKVNNNLEVLIADKTIDLRRALESANDASKAKSDFLATMSHEIRTPMNGVLGMLDLLSSSNISYEHLEKVKIAQSSGNALLSLINDVLDFSKIEVGKLELEYIEFNLIELLSDVVLAQSLSAENKKVRLLLDTGDINHQLLIGDPSRIRQIFTNLIGNAIKFTSNGDVLITGKTFEINSHIKVSIAIKDNGIGIEDNKLQTLFTPFTQADTSTTRKYGGSGLGLAISKQLCELMQGNIQVTSQLNVGSVFTVVFDLSVSKKTIVLPEFGRVFSNVVLIEDYDEHLIIDKLLNRWNVKYEHISRNEFEEYLAGDKVLISQQKSSLIIIDEKFYCERSFALLKSLQDKGHHVLWLAMLSSDLKEKLKSTGGAVCSKPITPVNLYESLCSFTELDVELNSSKQGLVNLSNLKRALIVEDNRINQRVAVNMLEAINIKADIANNGVEALTLLRENAKSYQFVLMDCQMPEMDGFTATEQIRLGKAGETAKSIYVIALTANAIKGDKNKCLSAGMNAYLAKPLSIDALKESLNVMLIKEN